MLCCFAADFAFAWIDEGHGPASPCRVALGTAKALPAHGLLADGARAPREVPALQRASRSVGAAPLCAGTGPAAKGERRPTSRTSGIERGTTACVKNSQHVLSPLAALDVRKETGSCIQFYQYFLKQLVPEQWEGLEPQVCGRAVFCGCSCDSPFFMRLGLHRGIFPATVTGHYFFPESFQRQCEAVNPGGVKQHNPESEQKARSVPPGSPRSLCWYLTCIFKVFNFVRCSRISLPLTSFIDCP